MAHRLELTFSDCHLVQRDVSESRSPPQWALHLLPHQSSEQGKPDEQLPGAWAHTTGRVPPEFGGTRWVGHLLRTPDHFLRGYMGRVRHLEQVVALDCYAKYSKSHHQYVTSSKQQQIRLQIGNIMFQCFMH